MTFKTIKELESYKRLYSDEKPYLEALKDVLELIDKLAYYNGKDKIHGMISRLELKKEIEG